MSSKAARANQKISKAVRQGKDIREAFQLATQNAQTKLHGGNRYAMFDDDSFLRVVEDRYAQVLVHQSARFHAHKIVLNIHAYCDQCGEELWCDMNGRPNREQRFELPGTEIGLCTSCQRQLVVRALVGE